MTIWVWRGRRRTNAIVFSCCAIFLFLFYRGILFPNQHHQNVNVPVARNEAPAEASVEVPGKDSIELVVASMKKENVTWLDNYLMDWKKVIYVVDDPKALHTVPVNKGREAMVFLTYIIERYDSLPENIIFHHAERFQWHNDDPNYDSLPLLQRFRIEHLRDQGYVNLRCAWVLGCPSEIKPFEDDFEPTGDVPVHAKHVYKTAFEQLFPGAEVPTVIGVTCCSQFAVTKETVRSRPREDYVSYRDWLTKASLGDDLSGRVLEYSWHIIFGKEPVHCPAAPDCYCRLYGLCDMRCDKDKCDGQYTLPPWSTLPQGWPRIGWDKEDRGWVGDP